MVDRLYRMMLSRTGQTVCPTCNGHGAVESGTKVGHYVKYAEIAENQAVELRRKNQKLLIADRERDALRAELAAERTRADEMAEVCAKTLPHIRGAVGYLKTGQPYDFGRKLDAVLAKHRKARGQAS